MNKKSILEIKSVYTANAFKIEGKTYVGAGSETTPAVYVQDLATGESSLVDNCPGGVMSFVPVPGHPDLFYSIQGLFPPFVGADAGVYMHRREENGWETVKAMDLPFAHRCDILEKDGECYVFAASCSKFKENPADWSLSGELYVIPLDPETGLPGSPELVYNKIWRHHGMLKACIKGEETLLFSGAEGIFYMVLENGKWAAKQLFDHEVSEFSLIDLDGDGVDELVTIEPFHGNTLNVYKCTDGQWNKLFQDELWFGHGLSAGMFNGEPIFVVGNRRGPLTLNMYRRLEDGSFSRETLEEEAGPTQTLVFTADDGTDYILSANQLKNEVALYYQPMDSKSKKIGLIGLGVMGKPMAKNLLKGGFDLTVFDIKQEPVQEVVALGAKCAATPAELAANCDVIITMLPNSPHVEAVVCGKDGILETVRPGSVFIDMSSISPVVSKKLCEIVAQKGVEMLDAPVSGGEPKAIDGTMSIMVGGKKEVFDSVLDVFKAMGDAVTLVGDIGSGNTCKLANQIMVALHLSAVAEAMVFAEKAGVDPEKVYQAIRGGLAGSTVLDAKMDRILDRNFKPGGPIWMHTKDLLNVRDAALAIDAPIPLTTHVLEAFKACKCDGHVNDDHCGVIQYWEKLANVMVKRHE